MPHRIICRAVHCEIIAQCTSCSIRRSCECTPARGADPTSTTLVSVSKAKPSCHDCCVPLRLCTEAQCLHYRTASHAASSSSLLQQCTWQPARSCACASAKGTRGAGGKRAPHQSHAGCGLVQGPLKQRAHRRRNKCFRVYLRHEHFACWLQPRSRWCKHRYDTEVPRRMQTLLCQLMLVAACVNTSA